MALLPNFNINQPLATMATATATTSNKQLAGSGTQLGSFVLLLLLLFGDWRRQHLDLVMCVWCHYPRNEIG